jgi:N-acetylglutamate synthase-like GNAT family acetyltransferase
VWVAERDSHIVGVLLIHDHADHLIIDNLAVEPATQGAGVGSELLRFAEQRARELRVAEVRLSTNEKMTENLAYYPHRGYLEIGRGVQAGFARVHFSKQIRESGRRE